MTNQFEDFPTANHEHKEAPKTPVPEGVSDAIDLVPVVGGTKMVIESVAGKTLAGKELSKKERMTYGAVGAGSVALDLTGVGAPEGEAMVMATKEGIAAEKAAPKVRTVFEKLIDYMKRNKNEAN